MTRDYYVLLVVSHGSLESTNHHCALARWNLLSAQSLPYDLARLYSRMLPRTSTEPGNGTDLPPSFPLKPEAAV